MEHGPAAGAVEPLDGELVVASLTQELAVLHERLAKATAQIFARDDLIRSLQRTIQELRSDAAEESA